MEKHQGPEHSLMHVVQPVGTFLLGVLTGPKQLAPPREFVQHPWLFGENLQPATPDVPAPDVQPAKVA